MATTRTYPAGVTSWIDLEATDLGPLLAFYGALLGWTFDRATPDDAPFQYFVARLDGQDVAGLGTPVPGSDPAQTQWTTYIAVDDADGTATSVEEAGGTILHAPTDAGEGGRFALCADPEGARFGLWQARRRLGAQLTNAPGAWNFSDLHTADPRSSIPFYRRLFGWETTDLGYATMIRRPGYGDHLAATVDPGIHERQDGIGAPPGFADAIGWVATTQEGEEPHWHVTFTVEDRDDSVEAVQRLGGSVVRTSDSDWTREALVDDPAGARFTLSQFAPQG